ncbi:MAG TPA: hypothetical protein VK968_05855, partial [Roseimicrobium sp.]|nr:hypothetical protein [Roseimicrobium sp.]
MSDKPTSQPSAPTVSGVLGINLRWLVGTIVVLGILAVAGRQGWRFYIHKKELHLAAQSAGYLEKRDIRSAVLSAREALKINPFNLEASRVMARVTDLASTPDSIGWWGRVAELDGYQTDTVLNWASSGLRFNEWATVDAILGKVDEKGRKTARYHQIAGGLAVGTRQYAVAEFHFIRALRLETNNPVNQLNLATVRLFSTNTTVIRQSVTTLELLRTNPVCRLPAQRALVASAARGTDNEAYLSRARELIANPGVQFPDRLEYLHALRRARTNEFSGELSRHMTQAARQDGAVFLMTRWMNQEKLSKEALAWHQTLDPALLASAPVKLVIGETMLVLGDWKALQKHAGTGGWDQMEFMRRALLARSLREQRLDIESRNQWQQAVSEARQGSVATLMLAQTAESWGWIPESEELWWNIALGKSGQKSALKALYRIYENQGNSKQLLQVLTRALQLDPDDVFARNNHAMLSMILNMELPAAFENAANVYKKDPANISFISTQAFSLYLQKRSGEALKLLLTIPKDRLETPEFALIHGLVLADQGDRAGAIRALERARRAKALLP